jgi:hypothetical protein
MSEAWAFVQLVNFFLKLLWKVFTNKYILGFLLGLLYLFDPATETAIPIIIYIFAVWAKMKINKRKDNSSSINIENHNHIHNLIEVNNKNKNQHK